MGNSLQVRSFIGTHDMDWEDKDFYRHDSLEITAVFEGRGLFRWGKKEVAIEKGNVVLIPSNIAHSFHARTSIRFGVLLMGGLPSETEDLFHDLLEEQHPRIIALSLLDQKQYEALFRNWLRVVSSSLKEPSRSYLAWIQVLLLFFHENSKSDQQALSITNVADFIRQNLQQGIPISNLAALAGLSEEGLRKRFYKIYGMTPKHFQHMCRLAEAKWYLSSSEKDMQSIAAAIGFSQLHSFSSWFKKLEGSSPTDWKKVQRLYHQ